jgi:hypothetical protein
MVSVTKVFGAEILTLTSFDGLWKLWYSLTSQFVTVQNSCGEQNRQIPASVLPADHVLFIFFDISTSAIHHHGQNYISAPCTNMQLLCLYSVVSGEKKFRVYFRWCCIPAEVKFVHTCSADKISSYVSAITSHRNQHICHVVTAKEKKLLNVVLLSFWASEDFSWFSWNCIKHKHVVLKHMCCVTPPASRGHVVESCLVYGCFAAFKVRLQPSECLVKPSFRLYICKRSRIAELIFMKFVIGNFTKILSTH